MTEKEKALQKLGQHFLNAIKDDFDILYDGDNWDWMTYALEEAGFMHTVPYDPEIHYEYNERFGCDVEPGENFYTLTPLAFGKSDSSN